MSGPRLPFYHGLTFPESTRDLPDPPPRPRVPPLSEAELIGGYRGGVTPAPALVEPCICGGEIVCIPGEIPPDVAAHNQTTEHEAWRAAGGMEREVELRPRPVRMRRMA